MRCTPRTGASGGTSRRSSASGWTRSTTIGGDDSNHTQVSPRLNLRYDFADEWRLYGSVGRFTQAQHVEEWRVEEAQQTPDSAQVSIHTIVGLEYDTAGGLRLGLEAYSKRWTTVVPYFDNQLDPLALLPDLTPDRIRRRAARIRSQRTRAEYPQAFHGFAHRMGNAVVVARGGRLLAAATSCAAGTSRCRSPRDWRGRVRTRACRRWPAGIAGWPRTPVEFSPLTLAGTKLAPMGRLHHARSARQLDLELRERRSIGGRGSDQCHQPAQRVLPDSRDGRDRAAC